MSGRRSNGGLNQYKHFPPAPTPAAIRRSRLLATIEAATSARVQILQGPAGHGKSTVLQQVMGDRQGREHLTRWLSLDEADNDPQRFFAHLRAMLGSVDEEPGILQADSAVCSSRIGSIRRVELILRQLASLDRPVDLFFDEFQSISNSGLLAFFREFVTRVDARTTIFIGSRALPDIGLAKLLVDGRALVLRADDLRFDQAEVRQFFEAFPDLRMSPDEVVQIFLRSEGWPAALQLFRLSLSNPSVRDSLNAGELSAPRELAEYLAENVLTLQSERDREFLRKTALLGRLCAPLCNEVLSRSDSSETLTRLEKSGMFLRALDSECNWFRYHTLFSSILGEQLRQSSGKTASDVHSQAARWYLKNRYFEEAITHALACGDYSVAAEALTRWSSCLVAGGHLLTVVRFFQSLPLERVLSRPALAIRIAWALVFLRRWSDGAELFQRLRQIRGQPGWSGVDVVLAMHAISRDDVMAADDIVSAVPVERAGASGFEAFELSAVANLRSYLALARSDHETARRFLSIADAHSRSVDAPFSRGYTAAMSGVKLMLEGQLGAALRQFGVASSQQVNFDESFSSAAVAACYVWALYEADELDVMDSVFEAHRAGIAESALPDFFAVAYISAARSRDARGRIEEADSLLAEAEAICCTNEWWRVARCITSERLRRLVIRGRLPEAFELAHRLQTDRNGTELCFRTFSFEAENDRLGPIRLAIRSGALPKAEALLALESDGQRTGVLQQIKVLLLQALLAVRNEGTEAARVFLQRALALATPGGYRRVFLDEGDDVIWLLELEHALRVRAGTDGSAEDSRDFIAGLLGKDDPAVKSAPERKDLTQRELQMLQLVVQGVSNRGIAAQLFVSENTVKYHLKNVFGKLQVSSRTQAIAAVHRLHLLD